jgi:hypothetical protein
MEHYTQRVRANILPKSISQSLPLAFQEWHWTGNTEDHERPTETCELCEQESLRYHFEIRNDQTAETLRVGSQCILRFDVGVFDAGRRLSPKDAKAKLSETVRKMQHESCVRALREVLAREPNDILRSALARYEANLALSPKQINVVFWRLGVNNVEFNPSFFKVDLSKDRLKEDLKAMSGFKLARIWTAMTSAQRKAAERRGVAPPD